MRNLKEKLKSSLGASMIIAMVFMLICVFVGGSILAAASTNAYRLKHLRSQSEILAQRSAAMLISDILQTEEHSPLILKVSDYTQKIQPVEIKDNGDVVDKGGATVKHTVEFSVSGAPKLNALQRIVFEAAIQNYMAAVTDPKVKVVINGFTYDDGSAQGSTIGERSAFWIAPDASGKLTTALNFSGTASGEVIPASQAVFQCGNDYNCFIDFEKPASASREPNKLKVNLDAAVGKRHNPDVEIITDWDNGSSAAIPARVTTTNSVITSIAWANPKIVKGAA